MYQGARTSEISIGNLTAPEQDETVANMSMISHQHTVASTSTTNVSGKERQFRHIGGDSFKKKQIISSEYEELDSQMSGN